VAMKVNCDVMLTVMGSGLYRLEIVQKQLFTKSNTTDWSAPVCDVVQIGRDIFPIC
jgi:hypothetical protein